MLPGVNSAIRLLREKWRDPSALAQELYAIFTTPAPVEQRGPVTIKVGPGEVGLKIERAGADSPVASPLPQAAARARLPEPIRLPEPATAPRVIRVEDQQARPQLPSFDGGSVAQLAARPGIPGVDSPATASVALSTRPVLPDFSAALRPPEPTRLSPVSFPAPESRASPDRPGGQAPIVEAPSPRSTMHFGPIAAPATPGFTDQATAVPFSIPTQDTGSRPRQSPILATEPAPALAPRAPQPIVLAPEPDRPRPSVSFDAPAAAAPRPKADRVSFEPIEARRPPEPPNFSSAPGFTRRHRDPLVEIDGPVVLSGTEPLQLSRPPFVWDDATGGYIEMPWKFPEMPDSIKPGAGGGGGTTVFIGKVVSGSGDTYQVELYPDGKDGEPGDTVEVVIDEIHEDETIDPDVWLYSIFEFTVDDETTYTCQVPIWRD